jgi:hypothetical protein
METAQSELITLVLAIGAFSFVLLFQARLKFFPGAKLLLAAFLLQLFSWCCTNLEAYFFPSVLNFIEHLTQLGSVLFLLIWTLKISRDQKART